MKVMICGYARHGKDTVAEILNKEYGLKFDSSSHIAMRTFLRYQLASRYGLSYSTEEECYADRVNHRKEWFDLICEFNEDEPYRLSALIFSQADIYVGIRNQKELVAAKEKGLFNLSIWVDASKRLPPESVDSNTITPDDCDVILPNNGSVEQLVTRVRRLFGPMIAGEALTLDRDRRMRWAQAHLEDSGQRIREAYQDL